MAANGGETAFGTWEDWGDVLALRAEQGDLRSMMTASYLNSCFVEHDDDEPPEPPGNAAASAPRALCNVVNLEQMADRLTDGDDKRLPYLAQLVTHIGRVGTACVDNPLLKQYNEGYYLKQGYGRLLARALAMQKSSSGTRSAAYRGHAIDVDQDDCHGRLLYNELVTNGLYNDDEYLMVKLSTLHHEGWISALADILGVDLKSAKREIIVVRYGSVPRHDVPWLRKLSQQVLRAATALLRLPQYAHLNRMYGGRPNPLFSRLAALLSHPEASNLERIAEGLSQVGSVPYCWMFDGGVFSCTPPYRRILVIDKLAELSEELQVDISIKPFDGEDIPVFVEVPMHYRLNGLVQNLTIMTAFGNHRFFLCFYQIIHLFIRVCFL